VVRSEATEARRQGFAVGFAGRGKKSLNHVIAVVVAVGTTTASDNTRCRTSTTARSSRRPRLVGRRLVSEYSPPRFGTGFFLFGTKTGSSLPTAAACTARL
jgi:hypothetical protein